MKNSISLAILIAGMSLTAHAQPLDISAWAYQLQEIDLAEIAAASDFDLIIIDYSSDGTASGEWSPAQIATVQASGKTVVSYMSIGEAEDYRWYWNPAWVSTPPAWLGPENPEWAGNYKVRFWQPGWQEIVFDYLDRIIAQGFDGVYLDIVDAYYYWLVENPEQPFADTLMINFIEKIDLHADSATGGNFYVFPQNAESIIDEDNVTPAQCDRYFAAIDGIGVEDVFFIGPADENNPLDPDYYRLDLLDTFAPRDKLVLSIEYLTVPGLISTYLDSAFVRSYYPYATRRDLDTLYSAFPAGVAQATPRPDEFRISAYPNPFNSAVRIAVDAPSVGAGLVERSEIPRTHAFVEIFDIAGRMVAEIPANGSESAKPSSTNASGAYRWQPDESLGSGVYLVRARFGDESTSKRVVYLK